MRSTHLDCDAFLTMFIEHVDGTGKTGVETVDRTQNFQRSIRVDQPVIILQRCFVRAGLPRRVPRTSVPCARHNALVIRYRAVPDINPMRERTAGCPHEADPACRTWPVSRR